MALSLGAESSVDWHSKVSLAPQLRPGGFRRRWRLNHTFATHAVFECNRAPRARDRHKIRHGHGLWQKSL